MRKPFRSATGLAAAGLLILAVVPSNAAGRAERELLGIRIWNKFSDVLNRYGQPTRIENGLITASGEGGAQAPGGAPGIPGVPGMSGMGGMGGGMSGMGGGMGSGGGMSGKMGGMRGAMGMPGMSGMPGMGGGMGSGGARGGMSMPGAEGAMGMPGMSGMGGMPGMSGVTGAGGGEQTQESEARSTWIYQRGPITNFFVFNKDGRVIQIESSGLSGSGGVTARAIRLGDLVAKVYRAYGWTGKVAKSGSAVTLDFTRESHVAFIVQDMKGRGPAVVDITVTLLDAPSPNPLGSGAAVAGGPGMGGGMPGMSGMSGMSGMGGGMMGAMGRPSMSGMGSGGMGGRRSGGKMGGGAVSDGR